MRFFHADSQVMKLDLGLGPRQSVSALKRSSVVILVGELQHLVACRSNDSGIDQADGLAGWDAYGAPQGYEGSSTGPTVFESGRPSIIETGLRRLRSRPRNFARSVSNCRSPIVSASTASTWAAQTGVSSSERRRRVASRAPTPGTYSVSTNKVRESRVRRVRRLARQRQFREGSHLNIARPRPHVGNGDATHLGIVFG